MVVKYGLKGEKDARERWGRAKQFSTTLNNAEIPYPFAGIDRSSSACRNSNSAFASVAVLLGIPFEKPEDLGIEGYHAPGIENLMLPKEDLQKLAGFRTTPDKNQTETMCVSHLCGPATGPATGPVSMPYPTAGGCHYGTSAARSRLGSSFLGQDR
ncbi:hypothetical protein HIM_08339 [Hirsutella minnesotensis 3608]|uniref:Uncharacterized protein n=1 Tax=Hirsutella minnesotensis 3608 TaxID=1043627 RepID=A0A0F7ZT10_9HYPO|nr:hypothetical protein HIM_08339 [Hirsutella minnesotensis 3608]